MQQNSLLLALFLLCFSIRSGSGQSDDLRTLLELKNSFVTNPKDETILRTWNADDPNFCNWTGVTCGGSVIIGLNLSSLGLTGSISPSIGRFNNLTHIDLSSNRLVGPIPTTLSNLSASLETLHLFSNRLSGEIPSQLGSLVNLKSLKLGDNELNGSIPETFGNLVSLRMLALASCRLTGTIPSQLGRLVQLQALILQDNELEGLIPPDIGNCTSLVLITAAVNRLNGSLPAELSRLISCFPN
ncbi:PREDICTED: LRR receptor-like serine/threonine-protein kinase GSO2 [Camelina sativa]|uniref:LRR receptor-like serine/threonine-protein kinase GSO2 n=1 Tax=Camelina sativa TaxID=90675 RepID=A0ABM1R985_CAMSA|nr:PREDICTED: LRR receptor-like serine/threonine-protein kinase GSO2 [Camelina sativa]